MRVVVTGASRGIGAAIAERLTSNGHEVWALARSGVKAKHGGRCDVADWEQVQAAKEGVAYAWSHVDAVICAAAIQGVIGPTMGADPAVWRKTVEVNLVGTFHVIRAFWDLLGKAPRRGKVICFSGGGAAKARPNFSAYAVSKTGVVRLVETLAEEWQGLPVDINAVGPGSITTDMTREIHAAGAAAGAFEHERAAKQLAGGGDPLDRVLDFVEWLLSEKSDGISGRLFSAQWDAWETLGAQREALAAGDVFQLRRILPEDRRVAL